MEKKNFNKVSLFLFILVITGIFCGQAHSETIWDKRKRALEGTQETAKPSTATETANAQIPITPSGIDPFTIIVPDQYGAVIDAYKGTNGNLIIHIQDAHANYEAQKNIASILESLINDYNLNLILREGSISNRDFTYLRAQASLKARENAAERLLKDATITGEEYLNLTSDYPMSFQGIEDRTMYDEMRNALWEIDKFKDIAGEYVNKMILASDAIKKSIYNEELLNLDNKKNDYEKETIDLLSYYTYLYKKAEEKGIPLYVFPNFGMLIKIDELEKKIDLAKIRDGTASEEETKLYDEYRDATRKLNVNGLFKEEPLLENALENTLSTNLDQKNLLKISKALNIMNNLLRIKVVPEEYQYFKDNKKDFDPQFWTKFLNEKSTALGIALDIPNNFYAISDNLPKIENFYRVAMAREEVFLKKSEERIKKDKVEIAALIAGGFHTPTLTRLLADRGYSYVVISPKVTTPTDDALYRERLKGEWLPEK